MPDVTRIGVKTMRKAPVQLTLRRAYFLQQPIEIRGLIVILLHVDQCWSYTQIAKYLGVSQSTVWRMAQDSLAYDWLGEDVEVAQSVLDMMDTPLYATHW